MPGFLLHAGAVITCAHGGQAQPVSTDTRVLVSGQPVVLQPIPHSIAGCTFNVGVTLVPCVTAQWTVGATRVFSNGMPVLLASSQATCTPNGTPVMITTTQTRVMGM